MRRLPEKIPAQSGSQSASKPWSENDDYIVGVISILLRLAGLTYLAPTAIGVVFGPLIAKKNANNEEFTTLKTKMLLLSVLSVSFVSLFVFLFSDLEIFNFEN